MDSISSTTFAVGTFETSCLVCGAFVPMRYVNDSPKICDKCKEAILKMRELMGVNHAKS